MATKAEVAEKIKGKNSDSILVGTIKDLSKKYDESFSLQKASNSLLQKAGEKTKDLGGMLKPGSLVKMAGMGANSPLIMMLGDKINDMTSSIGSSIQEQKNNTKNISEDNSQDNSILNNINKNIIESKPPVDFNKEQRDEKQLAIQEQTLNALQDIRDKKSPEAKDGNSFWGWLFGLLGFKGLQSVTKSFKTLGSKLKIFFKPFTWLGQNLGILTKEGGKVAKTVGGFSKYFKLFGKILGKFIMPIMIGYEIIKGLMSEGSIKDKIVSATSGVISLFTELPAKALNWIAGLFGFDLGLDGSKENIKKFINENILGIIGSIKEFFNKIPGYVKDGFDFLVNLPTFLSEKATQIWESIKAKFSSFTDLSFVDKILAIAKNTVFLIPNTLWSLASKAFPEITASISEYFTGIKESILNIGKGLMYSILPDWVVDKMGFEKPEKIKNEAPSKPILDTPIEIKTPDKMDYKTMQQNSILNKSESKSENTNNLIQNTTNNVSSSPDMSTISDDRSLYAAMGVGA